MAAAGGPPPVERWRGACELKDIHYGDEVAVPAGFTGSGAPPRGVVVLPSGEGVFVELVREVELEKFLERAIAMEARVLPVRVDASGERDRTLHSVVQDARQEVVDGLSAPRTALWCLKHLDSEGRSIEAHFEHFKSLCSIQPNQWGMEEYGQLILVLKAMLNIDQLDVSNLQSAELLLRRLQLIEYSYSDKLQKKDSGGGHLTPEEQAAFGAAARPEAKLMICRALVEAAKLEVEKEAGLAKSFLKARQARAELAKKG